MDNPTPSSSRWLPAFDRLLETVQGCGPHGHLVDVRESLRSYLGPSRPLVVLCPHADDGAISAACLVHEYSVRRGLPVVEVLVFAGEQNVAASWLDSQKKATVREAEFRLECNILGAEPVCWNLEGYRMPGYQPTAADVDKVVEWFDSRRPGAVIVPPPNDAHVAHRVTRALAAIGLVGARLTDCAVLSGWTPWGPLPKPNAYLTFDGEAERHEGMGHPLPCLAGLPDRLHPVLLASGPCIRRPGTRMGRGPQPGGPRPPHRRTLRRRRALPDRYLRPASRQCVPR